MIKLSMLFRKPVDVDEFEDHFAHRHVPLIAAMPKVVRTSVSRAIGAPRGEPPYYLIHDVYFEDMASLHFALNSAEGRAAGADLMAFAREIVTVIFFEVWGEDLPSPSNTSTNAPPTAASPAALEPSPASQRPLPPTLGEATS
ncbi:MAG: EthD family reductase [Thermoflexales bacterium]